MTTINEVECLDCNFKGAVCSTCKVLLPITDKYFYTTNGKFKTSKCKECKKKYEQQRKFIKYRDRREYMRKYRERKKAEKMAEKKGED